MMMANALEDATPSDDLISRTKQATEKLRSLDPNSSELSALVNPLVEEWAHYHPPLMLISTDDFVQIMLTGARGMG